MEHMRYTESDIIATLAETVKNCGGVRACARNIGVSPSYLSEIMHRKRGLSAEFVAKLGFNRVDTVYFTIKRKR